MTGRSFNEARHSTNVRVNNPRQWAITHIEDARRQTRRSALTADDFVPPTAFKVPRTKEVLP